MAEIDEIIEDEFPRWIPSWILLLFIRPYYNQGGIYIEDHPILGECPTICSGKLRWMEKLEIWTYSQKRADKLSWKFFHEKYPHYDHFVQLF